MDRWVTREGIGSGNEPSMPEPSKKNHKKKKPEAPKVDAGPLDRWLIRKRTTDQDEPPLTKKAKTEDTSASSNSPGLAIDDFELDDDPQHIEQALLEGVVADEMEEDEDEKQGVAAYLNIPHGQSTTWSEIVLSRCVGLPEWEYLEPLSDFLEQCRLNQLWRPTSLNPIRDFVYASGNWASHDREIDRAWEKFSNRIVELSGGKIDIRTLSKPSGPFGAVLTTQWHYPTWTTSRPMYGMTMDHTNASLRAQQAKFDIDDHIKTQDTIPIREAFVRGGVDWGTVYTNWSQIKDECCKFVRWLNSTTKIIILVSEENIRQLRDYVNLDETVEAIKIELDLGINVFGDKPSFQKRLSSRHNTSYSLAS
ncbi:hypothetical protein ACHAPO_002017 [Fusarium lateritium]